MATGGFAVQVGGIPPLRVTITAPQSADIFTTAELSGVFGNDMRFDQPSNAFVASKLYMVPFFNPWPDAAVTAQVLRVQAATAATSKYAWGIYADLNGRPDFTQLLMTTGGQSVTSGSTGVKTVSQSNIKLPYGVLWVGFVSDTAGGAGTWALDGTKDNGNGYAQNNLSLGRVVGTDARPDSWLRYDYTWSDATPLPTTSPGSATRNVSGALSEALAVLPTLSLKY